MTKLEEFLANTPFTTERKVYWGEMDAMQHVNNTQYFRYFEDLRTDFSEQQTSKVQSPEFSPVVAEINCQFLAPIHFPDLLYLGLSIEHIGDSQVIHRYDIFSTQQSVVVATGIARMVNIDPASGKKQSLPDTHKALFTKFMKPKTNEQ